MEFVLGFGAALLVVYGVFRMRQSASNRQSDAMMRELFPRSPLLNAVQPGVGPQFSDDEIYRLQRGGHYEPQMTRQEVLDLIKTYGHEAVRRHLRDSPNLPLSYIRLTEGLR